MRAADPRWIVDPRLLVAAAMQFVDAGGRQLQHVGLGAERYRLGRAGLGAGRLQPDRHPVGTQRALVGLAVLFGDARDVERAAFDAIAAADAVLGDEVDNAVGVLHDRAGRRAGRETA